ncbi:IclR family transcriptional regulator [Lampropedia aestuarii]|uniref:IclR family transcriptional regulator n=1 Tax=Lampropedia aestuarii TaxID=2562762 RepID=A0A4S5BMB5_9BURK|nr:IclR family transcriptional regulator [Lampropedia aestuarii]MDH5858109.1 IclR family transcriptional regulator [Lampropedia aestuarii]THJ33744.1 IclR family transcriptional regulator [Lampropedia aestuarii]
MEHPLIPPPSNSSSSLYVQSLATGMKVLRAFGAEHPSMSLPEIAAATGISKSAAQRFAFTLEALGLLNKDPHTKRYSLSSLNLEPGYQYLQCHPLLERANPYLLDLNQRSGETVNFAEPSGDCMVYIGRFSSLVRLIMHMPVGQRIPIYCSSTGRMYLSQFGDEEVHAFLSSTARVRYTPQTETELDKLCQLVQKARHDGYSWCSDQYYTGDLALSVPVTDPSGATIACINLSVSSLKWTSQKAIEKFVPMMLETARLISTTPPHPSAQRMFKVAVQPRSAP